MSGTRLASGRQMSLDLDEGACTEVFQIDESGQHGEVFTRRWVVELILDLAGFTADRDLATMVAVEPSCGAGAFLVPMVERLVESCRLHGRSLDEARMALRAFDLLPVNAELAQKAVVKVLTDDGIELALATDTAASWVRCGDFLLTDHGDGGVDFVLGNPPYIRLEDVPAARGAAYRRACPTMRGRSDIFVGFIETGLRLLAPEGVLGFIVADRWMHNQYGAGLRDLVSADFAVEAVVSMHDVAAFEEPVSAYPAVDDHPPLAAVDGSVGEREEVVRREGRPSPSEVVGVSQQAPQFARRSVQRSFRPGSTRALRGLPATPRTSPSLRISNVGSNLSSRKRPAPAWASASPPVSMRCT